MLASFKLPPMLAHRRKTGDLGKLRPLPWALVIAILFVLVSRIGNLQPGYLYGIVLGAIFVKDVSDKEEGRETFDGCSGRWARRRSPGWPSPGSAARAMTPTGSR